jgi:hypothetical protein
VFQSFFSCVSSHWFFFFCKFIFSFEVDSISACHRFWLSVPEAFFRTRLSVCDFSLVFKYTHSLLKFSTRVPTLCSGSARGYTGAVLVTVAGLLGSFSAWGGAFIPSCGEKSSSQKFRVWGCTVSRLRHSSLSLCLFFSFSIEKSKRRKDIYFMVFRQVLELVFS